jgi:hypothetical protein
LNEFRLNKGCSNSDDCPCVFIRKPNTDFCIIFVYIDDLNIISHTKDIDESRNHVKKEFEMNDLGKTKFCFGLQIEHLQTGVLIHQSAYIQIVLEKFNMYKAYPLKTLMVVRALEKDIDQSRLRVRGM